MERNEKQAILIMAHNNLFTLMKIIEILDSDFFDLYIHIDKKSDIDIPDIKKTCKKSKIFVFKEFNVGWADFSQVSVELFLLSEAKKKGYRYYHLISGNDMPLKHAKDIYGYFSDLDYEFVHYSAKTMPKEKIEWVKYYHFFMEKIRGSFFYQIVDKACTFCQKIIFVNRLKNSRYCYMTGANWFSITDSLADYVLTKKDEIKKMFNNTRSPDEVFLQTIIENSSFKDRLYNKKYDNNYESCERYIRWDGNVPHVFTKDDYSDLIKSNMMFARKFDERIDKEIIILLYNRLKD